MSSTKLVLAGVAAAALLAVLWWQRRDDGPAAALGPASAPAAAVERPRADGAAAAAVAAESPPLKPADARPGEVELRARASEETYARIGGVLVDHIAARGLSRADAEPVVRRFIDDNLRCLFDALRAVADAQAVSYDSVLDAVEADLYDTDGPLLGAVIDVRAVQSRGSACSLTAAQHAGIEPAALDQTTRAALARGLQR